MATILSRRTMLLGALPAVLCSPAWAHKRFSACGVEWEFRKHRGQQPGKTPRRFFFVHGDETTARDCLIAHLEQFPGEGLLVQNSKRTITLADGVQFDPNRMFTEVGLRASLRRWSPSATEAQVSAAVRMVEKSKGKILKRLRPPKNGLLVALHNNSRGYSMTDEEPISNAVSWKDRAAARDFMLCTDREDFARLRNSPFNCVLQEQPQGEEDGSLSRTAVRLAIRYVNIEAAMGNAAQQQAMLRWLVENLP